MFLDCYIYLVLPLPGAGCSIIHSQVYSAFGYSETSNRADGSGPIEAS